MIVSSINEAARRFAHLISLTGQGEDVVVLDHGQPVARITHCETPRGERPRVGAITSTPVRYEEGCFAPLTDEEPAWRM